MKVTRAQIIARGLSNRCPNCGARTLFKPGTLFEVNKKCPACELQIERANDEGFFLGSMSLNYGVTIVGFLVPVLLLYLSDVFSGKVAAILAIAGAIVIPAIFYRSSRSWWLMNYYLFLPHHLPANRAERVEGQDENL